MVKYIADEKWTDINFVVPLVGSMIFDLHHRLLAKTICDKFPGLNYKYDAENKQVVISGKLNDYWYEKFQKTVFNNLEMLDELDTDVNVD